MCTPIADCCGWPRHQVAYHSREIEGMACGYANQPTAVKDDLGSVMDAIRSKFASMK